MELKFEHSTCSLTADTIFRMSECIKQQKLPFRSGEIDKSEFGDGDRTRTLTAIHGMFNNDGEHCMAAAALLSHSRETL